VKKKKAVALCGLELLEDKKKIMRKEKSQKRDVAKKKYGNNCNHNESANRKINTH
jgi:hypothetical protein